MKKVVVIGAVMLAVHLVLRHSRLGDPRIHIVDSLPMNMHGATIPPLGIFIVHGNESNQELINHELVHWQQYQRLGVLPYYYQFFRDYLIHGYDHHPMEQEARSNEDEYCRNNYTECVRAGTARTISDAAFRS